MSEFTRDLLVMAVLVAPIAGFIIGRIVEHRYWRRQREGVYDALGTATRSLAEVSHAEAEALDVVRTQRHLLAILTSAAAEIAAEPGPITEARHRMAWAADKARQTVL